MCGIAGVYSHPNNIDLHEVIGKMTDTMILRGPDGSGIWCDPSNGIALGQRRLAIIDLSAMGHQPMTSSCGRFTITYNGEVYNSAELRQVLKTYGRRFRGHSDTEVIVEGFAVWGVRETVERLIGMFAFGVWDAKEKRLSLGRDRLGIKPIYWSIRHNEIVFGSELKALVAFPHFDRTINRDAIASYMRHSYIPAPQTIYKSAKKLEPGCLLHSVTGSEPLVERYWSLSDAVAAGRAQPLDCSDVEAVDQLETLLGDAVARRMIADVPLGAFLSGGIDSSTIVALMQKHSATRVKTFSIGFNIPGYNEAHHAAKVAQHLGTDHTECFLEPAEARDIIPKMSTIYDEPFSDASQIPTFLVSQITREQVKVALSGDGGDELFAGYKRYVHGDRFAKYFVGLPRSIRSMAGAAASFPTPGSWDKVFRAIPALRKLKNPGDKIHKFANVVTEDADGFYLALASHWNQPDELIRGGTEVRHPIWAEASRSMPDFIERMQYLDTLTYLPDDILTKVDRASMAVSLEVRVPMIDHRVVEFAWRLPQQAKLRNSKSKWLLRQLLYKHVPRDLIDRPKTGFGVPIDQWLREPLKDWAEELLSPGSLNKFGLIDPVPVQLKWKEHLSGKRNWQYLLWDVLMLQQWCEEWL